VDEQKWRKDAACLHEVQRLVDIGWVAEEAYDLWFPLGSECEGVDAAHARAICNGGTWPGADGRVQESCCPVRRECLEANIDQKHGLFGGTTPKQREQIRSNRLRRNRRRAVRA